MTKDQEPKRLYTVFVHATLKEDKTDAGIDHQADWRRDLDGIRLETDRIVDKLTPKLAYLQKILAPKASEWRGFGYVFIDVGWSQLLAGELDHAAVAALARDLGRLVDRIYRNLNEPRRLRIVTANDLLEFVEVLRQHSAQQIHGPLTGGQSSLLYDAPKAVEAIIRIACIGSAIPLFRFDDDVIFSGSGVDGSLRTVKIRRTQESISELNQHYDALNADPAIHYFIFSGHYGGKKQTNDPASLVNGYATRLGQFYPGPGKTQRKLFVECSKRFLSNLWKVGANPELQIISGAGLCLSDSAILDLPPFSNFRQLVLWIDDHLKYALHHELLHFGYEKGTLQRARLQNAVFEQKRVSSMKEVDAEWHIDNYAVRLLLGCIADRWLREDAQLKLKWRTRTKEKAVLGKLQGHFAKHLRSALLRPKSAQQLSWRLALAKHLFEEARVRLEEMCDLWKTGYQGTGWHDFVCQRLIPFTADIGKLDYSQLEDVEGGKDFDSEFKVALRELIEDFISYIDQVEFWGRFVQAVRIIVSQRKEEERLKGLWFYPE